MKKLIWLALLMLAGCTGISKPQPQVPAQAPAGLIKILADDRVTSYVDFRVISTYQGNSHLRRFYFINNYAEQTLIIKNPPVYVSSSRAIDVINCDKNQRAVMGRTLFSKPFAEGDLIHAELDVGQWETFPKDSLFGIIAETMCSIPVEKLKPEPAKENRKPLLD
ncbi:MULTISPECIES: surface-adhesin E family protein [Yersinia]|nr:MULTISPECIES: surface-adhesin E family protein [Yersinia]MCB5297487.1 surface-adhesin E family protein [Yersinia intermedia]MCB5304182.1 surface-adhesin E family protein [Yersinia bercovieri]MDA5481909.1 surface-adhesin E family protein [Yersinia intermedia]MDN0103203.1 surface-adhesin E family protein [Yersinia bercovieri]MDN0116725.1 surface-adhesin E family protein [Yersinia intermedia]